MIRASSLAMIAWALALLTGCDADPSSTAPPGDADAQSDAPDDATSRPGAICENGDCRCADPARTNCWGYCVDLRNDPRNCGACDRRCSGVQVCLRVQCVCPDPSANAVCGETCRNLSSDETSCGFCDHACGPGQSCRAGTCLCLRDDLMTNPSHCGACGHRCEGEFVCVEGACRCPSDRPRLCGGYCVDVATSRYNCGACGDYCPSGANCVEGRCVCPDARATRCESACVDVATDRYNCGACDHRCPYASTACVEGRCACPGERGAECGGFCVDVARDAHNCGGCAVACAAGEVCTRGACLPSQVSPPSGARLSSARPTFRWGVTALASVRVEVCAERSCAAVLHAIDATGRSATLTTSLAPGVYFWRLGATTGEARTAAWPFAVGPRSTSTAAVIGGLTDFNGDGLADVVVGAPDATSVVVYPGRRAMLPGDPTRLHDAERDGFGQFAAFAGDIDGDGFGDVVLGGFNAARGEPSVLYRGGAMGLATRTPVETISGAAVGVGDEDGDGDGDLVVATPDSARVTLYPGGAWMASSTVTREAGSSFGAALSPAWDVDADGFSDVLIGAPGTDRGRGAAWLYHGSATGLVRPSALQRPADVMAFGGEVAGLGDVNGDGLADVLVGASGSRAFVYLGGGDADALPIVLTAPGTSEAHAVAAGDVDGDGFDDVLVPLPALGRADLYRGSATGLSTTAVPITDALWTRATGVVVGVGDVDGDNCADVAVGIVSSNAVRLVFGDRAQPLTRQTTLTGMAGDGFGAAIF